MLIKPTLFFPWLKLPCVGSELKESSLGFLLKAWFRVKSVWYLG